MFDVKSNTKSLFPLGDLDWRRTELDNYFVLMACMYVFLYISKQSCICRMKFVKVVSKKFAKSIVMQLNLALLCIQDKMLFLLFFILQGWTKSQKDNMKIEHFILPLNVKGGMLYLIFMDNKAQEQWILSNKRKIPNKTIDGYLEITLPEVVYTHVGRFSPVSSQFPDNQKCETVRYPLNELMERLSLERRLNSVTIVTCMF